MTATVMEVMVSTLKASGVRRLYGLPGDSLNGFTDALRRDGEITWEHVRHEEAAGFAAAAEAALTGDLAVCAGSCGLIPVVAAAAGYILDEFPTTLPQAITAAKLGVQLDLTLDAAVYLHVPEPVLVQRLLAWSARMTPRK